MRSKKQITHSTFLINCILLSCLCHTAQARWVYVITDRVSTVKAYDIQDDQIQYQATAENLQSHEDGAVGLALDPDSEILFVTYEGSNIIEMLNARTMISEDNPVTVTGASNLAGIAFDREKQKLYVVQRQNNILFVYLWDPVSKTLALEGGTYKILTNLTPPYALGIALDESADRLYVTNYSNTVCYYDTNDPNFGYKGSIDIVVNGNARKAVGIAIDSNRDCLYTGAFAGEGGPHTFLVKTDITDINEPSFTENNVGANVIGIAADNDTGLVYVTTYENRSIEVYNPDNWPAEPCDVVTLGVSAPADIILAGNCSYKPHAFDLVKDDNDVNCVSPLISDAEYEFMGSPYNWLYYRIEYDANGFADTNVIITDYLPVEVDYYSSDPCGVYDSNQHTVTWDINDISASDSNTLWIKVGVNYYAKPGHTIYNYCEIESDRYYNFTTKETTICCYGGNIIYVDMDANDFNNGTSWLNAYEDLQDAFLEANNCGCNQIRVAEGTYKPTDINDTSARLISFELLDDVAVYGGFPTGGGTWVERNPSTYETVLSGDIATPNDLSDNSYHVVKCQDVNKTTLDGFTITAGNADGSDAKGEGGGIYCKDSNNFTVANCIIIENEADVNGGGIYNYNSSSSMIRNSTFSNNSAREGGAVYNYYHSDPNIINCVFNGNTADYIGGGMVNSNESSPTIINCTFSGNSTTVTGEYSHGGAMCNWNYSNPNISNCTFSNNSAREGGAVYNYYSDPNIINCIFSGNTADVNGGGIYNYNSSSSMIRNCTFSNNSANYGGAVCNYYSDPNIINCIFSRNSSNFFGGGMGNLNESSPTITNCIFSGNYTGGYGGGGIGNAFQSPATINNCTFSGNYAYGIYGGGGMCNWESSPMVTNCIFWDNKAITVYDEIYNYGNSNPDISYSDIKGGWAGAGNIDADPCFFDVEEPNGSWTEDASYDSSTFQSTLTDSGANWSVNQLAGKFVNPDTSQTLQHFFIVSNDVNTIKVWSDVRSIAHYGDTYQIYDYHLKLDSACIDAGDPNGDYTGQTDIDGEPRVFDGDANETEIVDMGADEYYWSPADFNSDGLVNFFDYALFADAWQSEPNDYNYNDVYDLVDNNCIDSNDLARFCEDWLWQTAWARTFPFAYGQTMGRGMSQGMSESFALTEDLFPSIQAKQAQPELTAADIEEIIKWLAELWHTEDELRKMMSEDEWLKFMEAVIQAVKEQIYN